MKLKKLKKEISKKIYILKLKIEDLYLANYIVSMNLMELSYNIYDAKKFKNLNDINHYIKKYDLKNEYIIINIINN